MSDLKDVLLELRYAGIRQLPAAGDAGDDRVRRALEQEIAHPHRRFGLRRHKVAIGGFGVTPAALIAVVATAAAATGGAVFVTSKSTTKLTAKAATEVTPKSTITATALFRKDPGSPFAHRKVPPGFFFRKETVIPATVHDRVNATIPDYGKVQFWSAKTKQGGFCWAIKLPNGSWAGYPESQHPTGGFSGGVGPGCLDTEQQRSIGEDGRPSVEAATTYEGFDDEVKSRTGQVWELFAGYVTTEGHAAAVKDPASGHSTQVTRDGYFLLVEHPSSVDDSITPEILDATGEPLAPDYSRDGLYPGYKMGPTTGVRP